MNFKKGDKVRLNVLWSKTETVRKVMDCAIYTYENLNGWYHPSKVVKV